MDRPKTFRGDSPAWFYLLEPFGAIGDEAISMWRHAKIFNVGDPQFACVRMVRP